MPANSMPDNGCHLPLYVSHVNTVIPKLLRYVTAEIVTAQSQETAEVQVGGYY